MKFELGETVYALHFDKHKTVYLEECIIVGLEAKINPNISGDSLLDLRESLTEIKIKLFPFSYHHVAERYFLDTENFETYEHPENMIFKTKKEALLCLHGIVSDI